ncbi:MAG: NYN domain-containing protein [bacterium]|nr:NYN domain-containing protein [bacterium]
MKPAQDNIAYIDGANLYRGVKDLGWVLDYARFRIWLREKYGVTIAYLFIGLVPKYKDLYTDLQRAGYVLVFKETTINGEGIPKGNCDADLVLRAARDVFETTYGSAVLVSSDGDYACLVSFLQEKKKMRAVLSPHTKCSILLKRTNVPITYLDSVRGHVQKSAQKEKAPDADRTA